MKRQKRTGGYRNLKKLERDAELWNVSPRDLMLFGKRRAKQMAKEAGLKTAPVGGGK